MISPKKAKRHESLKLPSDPGFVGAAVDAVLEPYGLGVAEPGNQLRGVGILGVAEEIMSRSNLRMAEAKRMIMGQGDGALYTISDFPQIMNAISQRAMLAGWESEMSSVERFCGVVDVRSFRNEQKLIIGGLGILPKVQESGEFTAPVLAETVLDAKADAYGTAFGVSYQALVNNDLSGLIADAKALGRAAAATLNNAVFGAIQSNLAMLDGSNLFNATDPSTQGGHGNLATPGSALSSQSIGVGKSCMRRQCGNVRRDRPLNIRSRYLLVPSDLEEEAWQTVGLPQGFGESGSDVERYLLNAGRVEPISTPYLTNATGWYLAADPSVAPLINIAYLGGQREPTITSARKFETNGLEFVVQFDFGVAAGDWRGGYFNPGA